MANSLITSKFSNLPLTGIAYTSISLNTPILKFQPFNNDNSTDSISPIPLDDTSKPDRIIWLDETYFIVLYSNKPYFDLINSTNNLSKIDQKISLSISINTSSCSCAVYNKANNQLYLLDSQNRLYVYSFDPYSSGLKISLINDFVINDLTESISQIFLVGNNNDKLYLISNALYEYDLNSGTIERTLNLFIDKCNCCQLMSSNRLLVSSFNDRFINLVNLEKFKIETIFVLNNPIIQFSFKKYKNKSILIAIDEEGFVEIFKDPLLHIKSNNNNENNLNKRRKGLSNIKSIQPNTLLKIFTDASFKNPSRVDNVIIENDNLIIGYLENENYFIIDYFEWFKNTFDLSEIKIPRKKSLIDKLQIRNQDDAALNNYQENDDINIRTGDNFIDLDPIVDQKERKDEDEDEGEEGEDQNDDFQNLISRLESNNNNDSNKINKNLSKKNKIKFEVGTLTTNLTQALRNNDNSMFDTIINNTKDEKIVKNTIAQLEQQSILKILDKLAELIYKNKFKNTNEGFASGLGNSSIGLNTWVRYVLVYHGTYLVSISKSNLDLRRKLGLLSMSMNKRANNLSKLLELKGRLTMVSLQVTAIKEAERLDEGEGQDSDYEAEVEYVEELDDEDL